MSGKIRLRNYQSIGDASIELVGLTVVTGRTNLGKSALIRGVEAMLFGQAGDYYIQYKCDWVGGSIRLDDPNSPLQIGWRKVPANKRTPSLQPLLEINKVQHTKVGRDHHTLTAPYGILELDTATGKLRPQIASQHDPIYLVTSNETTVAEVFKMLGRTDVVTEAQRLAKKDLKDITDRRNVRRDDVTNAKDRYEKLQHVPAIRAELDAATKFMYAQAIKVEECRKAEVLLQELTEIEERDIPTPPEAPPTAPPEALALLEELVSLQLKDVPPSVSIPSLPDLSAVEVLSQLVKLDQELADTERQIFEVKEVIDFTAQEKTKMEAELKVCPTCERPFHGDH